MRTPSLDSFSYIHSSGRFASDAAKFEICSRPSPRVERISAYCLSTLSTYSDQILVDLDKWCEEAFGTEEYIARINASDQIRNCYEMRSRELNLRGLTLSSLPACIKQFRQLHTLNLSANRLTNLPDLGDLKRLKQIDLSDNNFRALPRWICNDKGLRELNLSGNPLTVLPRAVFALPTFCTVDLSYTNLSRITYEVIQRKVEAESYKGPCFLLSEGCPRAYTDMPLPEILDELYLLSDKERPDLFQVLSSSMCEHLRLFLHALRKTVHFEKGGDLQMTLAVLVTEHLELAECDPAYRSLFFSIVDEASITCGDRVVLYVIYLGVQKKLLEADLKDLKGLARLLIRGVWAIEQLRIIAEGKIAELGGNEYEEAVQVYLGYLIGLKNGLKLPIDLGDMRFFSDVTDADLAIAYNLVSEALEDSNQRDRFLALDRLWRRALEINYPEDFAEAESAEDWVASLAALTNKIISSG